jgi:hypothetical protein
MTIQMTLNIATIILLLGIWGRFTVIESHVNDLWNDYIQRKKEEE